MVSEVFPNSRAEKAGVIRGDILLEIEGHGVLELAKRGGLSSLETAKNLFAAKQGAERIGIKLRRGGDAALQLAPQIIETSL